MLLFNGLLNYRVNKYLNISSCFEIFPANLVRRNQKAVKSFGIGITGSYSSLETLMDVEEDFSEYEYDNL